MFDYKNSRGVPLWKNSGKYSDSESRTDSQWRWEFLRRRPDYREAWVNNFEKEQAYFDELDAQGLLDNRERYRSIGSSFTVICEPFHVSRIDAPWLEKPQNNFWNPTYGWSLGTLSENVPIDSLVATSKLREERGQVLFAFDINRPFEEQIQKVRAHFESHQRELHGQPLTKSRHHKRRWATYLQTIDARDQGATFEDLYIEIELSNLSTNEYDAALEKNLAASGLQLWRQAQDLMFKVTS